MSPCCYVSALQTRADSSSASGAAVDSSTPPYCSNATTQSTILPLPLDTSTTPVLLRCALRLLPPQQRPATHDPGKTLTDARLRPLNVRPHLLPTYERCLMTHDFRTECFALFPPLITRAASTSPIQHAATFVLDDRICILLIFQRRRGEAHVFAVLWAVLDVDNVQEYQCMQSWRPCFFLQYCQKVILPFRFSQDYPHCCHLTGKNRCKGNMEHVIQQR